MITTTGHTRKVQEKFMTESNKKKKGKKKNEKYKEKR